MENETEVKTETVNTGGVSSVKVEETTSEAPKNPEENPKKFAGKFDSVEDLEKAFMELQKTQEGGDPKSDEGDSSATNKKEPEQKPEDMTTDRNVADKALSDKGLDLTTYENEFNANGSLSEDSYKALEKAGLKKELVDSYIEGRMALLNAFVGEVKNLAGGDEGYQEITAWADKGGISQEEKDSYNKIMNSGDRAMIKMAVSGLVAKYREAGEGPAPDLLSGNAKASKGGANDIFASSAEVVTAMKDERYGKDPAYTSYVERKVARSHVFG